MDQDNPSMLENIDEIVKIWSVIAVPFYINDPNSSHKVNGHGSGFIVERHGVTFLVTALHVLSGVNAGDALTANIGGKGVFLNGLQFITSPEDDIAVAFIDPSWAEKEGLNDTYPLLLDLVANTGDSLNVFLLLGFPGSKNKVNLKAKETFRNLVGYSFSNRIEQPSSKTHINNPVAFQFDKKTAMNTSEEKINVGPFNGNSGGPVLEIMISRDSVGTLSVHASLAGVFIGWDKNYKEVICCRPDAVVDLIDELIVKARLLQK